MKKLILVISAWLVLLGADQVFADKGKLLAIVTRSQRSALEILQRERCDTGWLSQLLEDSNLTGSDWRKLPLGTKLYLNTLSCKAPPPKEVAESTSSLLMEPRPKPKTPSRPRTAKLVPKPEPEAPVPSPTLENRIATLSAENETLSKSNKELGEDKSQLVTERDNLRREIEALEGRFPWYFTVLALLLGVLLGHLVTRFGLSQELPQPPRDPPEQRITTDVDPSFN